MEIRNFENVQKHRRRQNNLGFSDQISLALNPHKNTAAKGANTITTHLTKTVAEGGRKNIVLSNLPRFAVRCKQAVGSPMVSKINCGLYRIYSTINILESRVSKIGGSAVKYAKYVID